MKAPALPEIFGNYALGDFVEVTPPPAISALPQTVGWVCLAAGLFLVLAFYAWKKLRHWYHNRYRREALLALQRLASNNHADAIQLNNLLKRVALAAYPREQVASLAGAQWGIFINRQCPEQIFNAEQLDILINRSYQPASIDPVKLAHLGAAVEQWITAHRGAQDV
jgi:hypothetical protein